MTTRPRLLDLFSGAGGAAVGYHRAGFEVVGVDLVKQPRYPFEFHQADALTFPLDGFDAIHASPPCHDHTTLSSLAGKDGTGWLLAATRTRLQAAGVPWVIENVPGAPMRPDLVLCGEMFGLRTIRHRWFELSWYVMRPGHPPHTAKTSTRKRRASWDAGMHISVTGDAGVYVSSRAMGIDWMTGAELSQAIPPAYCEFVGGLLLDQMSRASATPDTAAWRGVTASPSPRAGVAPDGPGPADALDPTFEAEVARTARTGHAEGVLSSPSASDPTFVPVFLDDTTDVLIGHSRPTRNITVKGTVL